jgi:16S rRNA (cytidine1402-2'-O)-methyltransferase
LLKEALTYAGTSVCYESPYRLVTTLSILSTLDPERPCVVARELTKKFETFTQGSAAHLLAHFTKTPPKGEIVLLISGIELK